MSYLMLFQQVQLNRDSLSQQVLIELVAVDPQRFYVHVAEHLYWFAFYSIEHLAAYDIMSTLKWKEVHKLYRRVSERLF